MAGSSTKPSIFISYAHEDEPETPSGNSVKWLSFVTGYLEPAVTQDLADLWVDNLMRGGDDWDREIKQTLDACDVFILLVSRHSLASKYILKTEIATIRRRQQNKEDVRCYPLLLTTTPNYALDPVLLEHSSKEPEAFLGLSAVRARTAHVGRRRRNHRDCGRDRQPQAKRPRTR